MSNENIIFALIVCALVLFSIINAAIIFAIAKHYNKKEQNNALEWRNLKTIKEGQVVYFVDHADNQWIDSVDLNDQGECKNSFCPNHPAVAWMPRLPPPSPRTLKGL